MNTQTDVTRPCPSWCTLLDCGEPDEEGRRLHGHRVPGPLPMEVIGHVECGPGDIVVVINGADHWTGERTRYLGGNLRRICESLEESSDEVADALRLADQLLAAAAVAEQAERTAEAHG